MENGESDRPFVREHIFPSKKKRQREFLRTLGRMFLCGAVFGIAAGIFLVMTQHVLGGQKEEQPKPPAGADHVVTTEKTKEEASVQEISDSGQAEKTEKKNNSYAKKIAQWNRSIVAVYAQSQWTGGQLLYRQDASFGIAVAKEKEKLYFLTRYMAFTAETEDLKVEFFDGAVCPAVLEGKDEDADIAVVSVKLEEIPKSIQEKTEVIKMGESDQLQTGSTIVLLGSPNGFLYSADVGMVSGMPQKEYIVDYSLDIYPSNMIRNENASGVVVSLDGKLLGILTDAQTADFGNDMVLFSGIPGIKRIITRMIRQEPLIYCGIKAENIPQAKRVDMGIANGIYVMEIQPNSPAARAGIRAGDIIQKVEDTEISSLVDFYTKISEYGENAVVDIHTVRFSSGKKKENKYIVRLQKKES